MGKGYEDLSRRGLIKLNKDFDQENDAKLLQYLTEHGDKYENIRPVESVIDRVDKVAAAFSNSKSSIKRVIVRETDKLLDRVINTISGTANMDGETINIIVEDSDNV